MKLIYLSLIAIFLFSDCSRKLTGDGETKVCPELQQLVDSGWEEVAPDTSDYRNLKYECNESFAAQFPKIIMTENCKEGLTRTKLVSLLGEPDSILQRATSDFKLIDRSIVPEQYNTLIYKCLSPRLSLREDGTTHQSQKTFLLLIDKKKEKFHQVFSLGR